MLLFLFVASLITLWLMLVIPARNGNGPRPSTVSPEERASLDKKLLSGSHEAYLTARQLPAVPEAKPRDVRSGGWFQPTMHKVIYKVNGEYGARASLTYQNESGGTEQKTVDLPWQIAFEGPRGKFLYLAAQKKSTGGVITSLIYIDETLVQTAESNSDYGIAMVSGRIP